MALGLLLRTFRQDAQFYDTIEGLNGVLARLRKMQHRIVDQKIPFNRGLKTIGCSAGEQHRDISRHENSICQKERELQQKDLHDFFIRKHKIQMSRGVQHLTSNGLDDKKVVWATTKAEKEAPINLGRQQKIPHSNDPLIWEKTGGQLLLDGD